MKAHIVLAHLEAKSFNGHLSDTSLRVLGVALIEGHESGLSALDTYSNRWTAALETLSARPLIQYNRDHDFDEKKRLLPDAPVYSPFIRHKPDAIP